MKFSKLATSLRTYFKGMVYLAFTASLLIPLSSNAGTCVYENRGTIRTNFETAETCTTDMILLTKAEYDAVTQEGISATLISLFEFSVEDFALFNAICLIGFITTHSVGRVVRYMGKT